MRRYNILVLVAVFAIGPSLVALAAPFPDVLAESYGSIREPTYSLGILQRPEEARDQVSLQALDNIEAAMMAVQTLLSGYTAIADLLLGKDFGDITVADEIRLKAPIRRRRDLLGPLKEDIGRLLADTAATRDRHGFELVRDLELLHTRGDIILEEVDRLTAWFRDLSDVFGGD